MAAPARIGRQATSLLSRRPISDAHLTTRSFSTRITTPKPQTQLLTKRIPSWQQSRKFTKSLQRCAAVQPAPKADSYLASGAIQTGKNLVDVKKVLVIGSGGLSIGQAGEFDYSGKSNPTLESATYSLKANVLRGTKQIVTRHFRSYTPRSLLTER